jgi:hypothetical protein
MPPLRYCLYIFVRLGAMCIKGGLSRGGKEDNLMILPQYSQYQVVGISGEVLASELGQTQIDSGSMEPIGSQEREIMIMVMVIKATQKRNEQHLAQLALLWPMYR